MFSSGKNALAICERCGFSYPYQSIVCESGTSRRVCPDCDDGIYSLISHPQNYPKVYVEESQGLEHPRPDVPMDVPTSLSIP